MRTTEPTALLVVLLLLAVPFGLGALIGRAAHDPARPTSAPQRALLLLAPPLAALALDLWQPRLDLWDAIGVGLCLGLGLRSATAPPTARAAQLALFCLVTELAARLLLPPGPEFAGDRTLTAPWLSPNPTRLSETTCRAIFPQLDAGQLQTSRTNHLDPQQPVVLHLGDSLLVFPPGSPHGDAAADPERFPLLLDASDPGRGHVNLGFPGASYDALLLVARTWLRAQPVEQVVLYAFLVNDLAELGRAYPCCREGLVEGSPGAPTVCTAPSPPTLGSARLEHLLVRSRDPIVLRVLSEWSTAMRHLRARAQSIAGSRGPWTQALDADDHRLAGDDLTARWQLTRTLLAALRDDARAAGADLLVVALPIGPDLRDGSPPQASSLRPRVDQLGAMCEQLGVPFLDAWPAFEAAPQPWSELFMADRYHLSLKGHATLADWLSERLPR
jgi:hypothetical protein